MKKALGCRFLTLIMAILAIMAAGCVRNDVKSDGESELNLIWEKYPDHIGDYYVSTAPLDSLLTTEYELASLVAFFPEHDRYDQQIFLDYEEEPEIRIEDVDREFPMEVFRKNHACYYTVYKVKEGGLFYVFFDPYRTDGNPTSYIFTDGIVACSRYLTNPMRRSAFYSIRPGKSTAQDVKDIDPNAVLSYGAAYIFSLSLLKGNKFLFITYHSDVDPYNPRSPHNPSNFIVEEIEVVSEVERNFYLNEIFPQDLPWNQ